LGAWLGSSRWKDAHFWTVGEVQQLLKQARFQIGTARGCVHYPLFNLAAYVVGEHDQAFSFLGRLGAALFAVRGDMPALTWRL